MPVEDIKKPVIFSKEKLREEQGFPLEHTKAFLEVAKAEKCVILTRTPGSSCEGPLAEGYAAKSFHIKAKSCNWGATAGFLCLDPFMNKKGEAGALDNLKNNYKSLSPTLDGKDNTYEGKTSSVIPLQISMARLKWLTENKKLQIQGPYSSKEPPLPSSLIGSGSVGQITVNFLFVWDKKSSTWQVYYDAGKLYGLGEKEQPAISNYKKAKDNFFGREEVKKKVQDPNNYLDYFKMFWDKLVAESEKSPVKDLIYGKVYNHYVPVLAMTNPHLEYDLKTSEGYKNAVTGDYDLFAVWPMVADKALDSRVAGMTADIKGEDIASAENKSKIGKVVGNISERVYLIAQMLNSVMGKGVKSVNRVYHSDEAGRPFLEEVDEAAVFTPDGKIFMVSPGKNEKGNPWAWQLSDLIRTYGKKNEKDGTSYAIFANEAWLKFLDDDVKKMITWSEAIPETARPSVTKK
jgi:hypothetical protein